MKNEIQMPDLGEGVIEGEVVRIPVSAGDRVNVDQILIEVMTDKASLEIPSSKSGIIKEVKVRPGDMVPVGGVLFVLDSPSDLSDSKTDSPASAAAAAADGSAADADHAAETDSKKSSVLKKSGWMQPGPFSPTQKPRISAAGPPRGAKTSAARPFTDETSPAEKTAKPLKDSVLAAPATRKLAQELGVRLRNVSGTGPKGAVLREDLLRYIQSALKKETPSLSVPFSEGERREKLTGVARIMAETMALSHSTIPHFTVMEEADVTKLIVLRKKFQKRFEKSDLKITYLSFIMKALVLVLKEFPKLNSVFDAEAGEIVYKPQINMGFAVDAPKGLLVPVIHDMERKSLPESAKAIQDLALHARKGSLKRENLTNSTFTVTNLGSLGGIAGTPLIHPPTTAIFGIYRISYRAVKALRLENPSSEKPENNIFEERPFMRFSLTADHRIIDGALALRFLKSLMSKIEDPSLLLLE